MRETFRRHFTPPSHCGETMRQTVYTLPNGAIITPSVVVQFTPPQVRAARTLMRLLPQDREALFTYLTEEAKRKAETEARAA